MGNGTSLTYLMESNGKYKIGKSKNPIKRLKTLGTGNPDIKLIGVCNIPEKTLQYKYRDYRFKGEWFKFDDKIKREVFNLFKGDVIEIPTHDNIDKLIIEAKYLLDNFDINKSKLYFDGMSDKTRKKLIKESGEVWSLMYRTLTYYFWKTY